MHKKMCGQKKNSYVDSGKQHDERTFSLKRQQKAQYFHFFLCFSCDAFDTDADLEVFLYSNLSLLL